MVIKLLKTTSIFCVIAACLWMLIAFGAVVDGIIPFKIQNIAAAVVSVFGALYFISSGFVFDYVARKFQEESESGNSEKNIKSDS